MLAALRKLFIASRNPSVIGTEATIWYTVTGLLYVPDLADVLKLMHAPKSQSAVFQGKCFGPPAGDPVSATLRALVDRFGSTVPSQDRKRVADRTSRDMIS